MAETILELKHITKKFPGVVALDDVSLDIKKGEVHTLVGENGAGKSTLIKIITGAHKPTSGEFWFEGKQVENNSPSYAKQLGIGVIYQELNLMPQLTVAENIFYGKELKKGIFLDKKEMNRRCEEIICDLGVKIDPQMKVSRLSIAEQQIVEIVKALSEDIKILIMDEPSAPLTNSEIDKMFEIVKKLKQKGVGILYISHRLEEVFEIGDRATVLRDGKYIVTLPVEELDKQSMIRYMVGRELGQDYPGPSSEPGECILKVENLTNHRIKNCSFELRKGEILGIAGLVGAGRTELVRAIFGADPVTKGTVTKNGRKLQIKSPRDGISNGIGLITEDRKNQGLLLNKPIDYNTTYASMDKVCRAGVIDFKKEKEMAEKYMKAMDIKAYDKSQKAGTLSGGNQQKVVLAKWLATDSDILIFDEPTRGIDVGAKAEIYLLMRELVESGKSIIMISSEMPELLGMSDRILVMHEGQIKGTLSREEATQEQILYLATL
ncbi:MAG: sugar ABC transporter ATP-binding protein [Eubacteriales bacterium]|nr:sugar ABC transporter ATP-binding protein [Eubacteriales bacterium]